VEKTIPVVTAIDSSVIFDFATLDPVFGVPSRQALRSCADEGQLVACDVVWAEVAGFFPTSLASQQILVELGIEYSPLTVEAALEAGRAWKTYRERGGPRTRVAADFLIGAHALHQADRLLTRDDRFYRAYFKHLSVLRPGRKS
jgi:predicted nucleic acid-binding protein